MHWIDEFDLFLFDFDGLLVDTERLHYLAYKSMCKKRGYELLWDFPKYYDIAQKSPENEQNHLYTIFPGLKEFSWDDLYQEKKTAYIAILKTAQVPLMPGVKTFLHKIRDKKLCVVTHSGKELVDAILQKNPFLTQSITHWFTREDYTLPKPSPDGYQVAIDRLASPNDRIIGFEDSTRGMQSLLQTKATTVVINPFSPAIEQVCKEHNCLFFSTFTELLANNALSIAD